MQFTHEMILQSDSGYCMPFEEKNKDVEMSLGYGKQKHPKTGEKFFHHGIDFDVKHYLLSSVATGNVSGLSLAGLVLSALLVFGRFGWLGKIAGAVLSMMMIGNNANMSQVLGGGQQKPLAQDTPQRELPKPQAQVVQVDEPPREQIHRGR